MVVPVTALVFVTGAFLLLAAVANRLRRGRLWLAAGGKGAPAAMRQHIEVVQSYALDSRRRLVLVRAEGGCALLLVGGPNDLMVPLQRVPTAVAAHLDPETSL